MNTYLSFPESNEGGGVISARRGGECEGAGIDGNAVGSFLNAGTSEGAPHGIWRPGLPGIPAGGAPDTCADCGTVEDGTGTKCGATCSTLCPLPLFSGAFTDFQLSLLSTGKATA